MLTMSARSMYVIFVDVDVLGGKDGIHLHTRTMGTCFVDINKQDLTKAKEYNLKEIGNRYIESKVKNMSACYVKYFVLTCTCKNLQDINVELNEELMFDRLTVIQGDHNFFQFSIL